MNFKFCIAILFALFASNNAFPSQSEIETHLSGMNLTNTNEVASYLAEIFHPYKDHLRTLIKESMSFSRPTPRADFITCDVCKPAVPILRFFLGIGIPQNLIVSVITGVCVILDLAPAPDLCEPTIKSYAEPTIYILKNKPELKMADFCGILNPGCTNVNASLTDWVTVIDNNKPTPVDLPPLTNVEKTKFLQFTDVHLDLDYVVGKAGDCGNYPICCRENNDDGEGENAAGPYGHFKCALPLLALTSIYDHAKATHPDVKYIFLTGDYIHSGVWLYGVEENSRHISSVTSHLRAAFPDTPIFPVTGNHEPDVVNMYPPSSIWATSDFDLEWMYTAASEDFTDDLPVEQLASFRKGGFYTVSPEPGLRLVIINSNLCYINNFWLAFDTIDPEGQLQWLATTLLAAETAGEVVHIIGHIQPGSGSCWPVWSQKYDDIINRFEGIIKAQYYGHSHTEYFTLAFEKGTERPISTSYIGPSTVTDNMHAGYKAYYADGERGTDSTWEIVDHETWILNILKSNEIDEPVFEKVYSAKEDYGLASFRPKALYDFVYQMIDDDALFEKFQRNHYKGVSPRYTPCRNKDCKIGYLCDLVSSNSADNSHCDRIRETINAGPSTPSPSTPSKGQQTFVFGTFSLFTLFVVIFSNLY